MHPLILHPLVCVALSIHSLRHLLHDAMVRYLTTDNRTRASAQASTETKASAQASTETRASAPEPTQKHKGYHAMGRNAALWTLFTAIHEASPCPQVTPLVDPSHINPPGLALIYDPSHQLALVPR